METPISVVIATHDKPSRLEKTLWSLCWQATHDFDVVVVSDGGDFAAVEQVVSGFAQRLTIALVGTTGPDTPLGAAAARNIGIRTCLGARVLIVDDDCLLPRTLVHVHMQAPAPKALFGLRRHLSEETHGPLTGEDILVKLPQLLYRSEVRDNGRTRSKIIGLVASGDIGVRSYAWTCHISYPKDKLFEVGGFWEEMKGSGHEDQELAVRMHRAGVRFDFLHELAVYHQDHKQCTQQATHQHRNRILLRQTLASPSVVTRGPSRLRP